MRPSSLVLILSAALLLVAQGARAQELRAELTLAVVEGTASSYLVTFPFANGLDDVADSNLVGNKCDEAVDGGDGMLNADDMICTLWGGGDPAERRGALSVTTWDPDSCLWLTRSALVLPGSDPPQIVFIGPTFPYDPEHGVHVSVAALGADPLPENHVVLEGSAHPAYPGRFVEHEECRVPPSERAVSYRPLHLPYDTCLKTVDEILCGVRGVDWDDADGDGRPDTCPGGLHDTETPGARTTVVQLRNVPRWPSRSARTALNTPAGWVLFVGESFELTAGESYEVTVNPEHPGRTWDPVGWCSTGSD